MSAPAIGYEAFRPGYYAVIQQQQAAFRGRLRVVAAGSTDDARTLVLRTDPKPARTWYAMTIPGVRGAGPAAKAETVEFDFFLDDPKLPRPPQPPCPVKAGSPLPPELAGGDRGRGETIFHGEKARCGACHLVRGKGAADRPRPLEPRPPRRRVGAARHQRAQRGDQSGLRALQAAPERRADRLSGLVRSENADQFRVTDIEAKEHVVAAGDIDQLAAERISIMPADIDKQLSPGDFKDLLAFLLAPEPPQEPKGVERPPLRSRKGSRGGTESGCRSKKPPDGPKPLNVLLVWGIKDHGPGEHDYPRWQREWSALLGEIAQSQRPHGAGLARRGRSSRGPHAIVFYHMHQRYDEPRYKEIDAFLARRRGDAVALGGDSQGEPEKFAATFGLAWKWQKTKFRHGPLELNVADHELTRGLPKSFRLVDETYWPMIGDTKKITVLATAKEEGREEPMLWTVEREKGRVLGCILGHYYWTFDDPLFRVLLLRGWRGRPPAAGAVQRAGDGRRQVARSSNAKFYGV